MNKMDKNEFMKMVNDMRFEMTVAGVRAKAFAKALNKNVKEAAAEANEAAKEFMKEVKKQRDEMSAKPRPCKCGHCECKEAVEPKFDMEEENKEEEVKEEQPKDEE